jgi:hypothetical protein
LERTRDGNAALARRPPKAEPTIAKAINVGKPQSKKAAALNVCPSSSVREALKITIAGQRRDIPALST